MRVKMISTAALLVAAGAATAGASADKDLDGNNRVLSGSDIFKVLTNDLLSQFPWGHDNFITAGDPTRTPRNPGAGVDASGNSSDGTYFTGGGQSVGDAALQANTQQISVGTASLKNTNYGKNSVTGSSVGSVGWIDADGNAATGNPGAGGAGRELSIQGTTEGLLIGLDGLSILGHATQAGANNGLAVSGKTLTVHHYVPSDARFFAAAGSGGSANATTKAWTLPGVTFTAADVGAKLAVAGATNAGNNNTFTIASVTPPSTITTVQAPVAESFAAAVNFTVYASRTFVVNDADTTFPRTFYGAVGSTYTFNNSLDVIRLIYGGLHHDGPKNGATDPEQGTFDAGSDVRRSLADNWGALFSGAVPSPSAKLNHVWRRSDLAGATNAFIALVNFGARGIGVLAPATANKTSPFANSGDANGLNSTTGQPVQFPLNSTLKSNGGPGDFADWDPIRRPALIGPNPSTTSTANVDLDQVAENDGTLGLVLPIFPPDALDGAAPTAANAYSSKVCSAGRFDLIDPGFTPTPATGALPGPQGGPFSGLLFLPYFLDTSVTPNVKHYNCIARSSHPPAFGAPSPADNRVFNLAVKSDVDGHYYKDLNGRFLHKLGFYRIHQTLSNALVTPGVPASGLQLAKQLAADAQAANLIVAEPFSVSFNGRGADTNAAFSGNVEALSLSGQASLGAAGQFDPAVATFPTEQLVKNLVIPNATPVYPLARRIWVNTLVGFTENPPWSRAGIQRATGTDPGPGTYSFDPNAHAFVPSSFKLVGGVVTPNAGTTDLGAGTAVRGLQGQEAELARAFQNSDHLGALFKYWGFVPLPSAVEGYTVDSQGHPANGITALDYPEDALASALPLNGTAETGSPYAAGHALSASAYPTVNNEDATVVSPADALTPYTLSGSAPPFPYNASLEPAHLPWPGSP